MKKLLNPDGNSWLTLIGCPLFTLRERALLFVRSLCNTNKGRTSLRRGYLYKGNKADDTDRLNIMLKRTRRKS
jgi:hypothetical protein